MLAKMPKDEFFIGWLPVPAGYAQFIKPVVIVVILIGVAVAGALALFQRDPGTGQWDDDRIVMLRGVAFTNPYAMLRVAGEKPGDAPRSYLLVEDGKFGALPRVSSILKGKLAGVAVEVKGTILHRDDRWMLALEEGDAGMRALGDEEANALPPLGLGDPKVLAKTATLHGEIVDSKCYLGAMKPGGGKTHKACAMRCIAGGIPPMLVTRDGAGHETFYLLITPDGGVANETVYPFVGDRVEVTGSVEQFDDVVVLRAPRDLIHRQ
jgi:hypothetical protein